MKNKNNYYIIFIRIDYHMVSLISTIIIATDSYIRLKDSLLLLLPLLITNIVDYA